MGALEAAEGAIPRLANVVASGQQHRRCIIPQTVTQSSAPEDG